jgi:hypothetical protein
MGSIKFYTFVLAFRYKVTELSVILHGRNLEQLNYVGALIFIW